MYLLTEMLLFLPLAAYACFRVRKLLPRPGMKRLAVPFFIFLFCGYFAAEGLEHSDLPGWADGALLAGYFCLPYLLYLVLAVLAVDLAILLARAAGLLARDRIKDARFGAIRLTFCLALPALVVLAGAWNNNRMKIREYAIEIPRRNSALEELTIVYASDFHLTRLTGDRLLERFVDRVNALRPDIVLLGGDILEGHGVRDPGRFEAHFRRLRAKYGVFAAPGNHERPGSDPWGFFARSGVEYLEDRVVGIDGKFYLAGRRDGRRSRRMPVGELLRQAPEDLPVILLDHRPTDLENVSRSRVDLQLSGHTHNGQLFPVNLLVMPLHYELAWGIEKRRDTWFIVSSGLQAWGPPVKTAGDSEILRVRVAFRRAHGGIPGAPWP